MGIKKNIVYSSILTVLGYLFPLLTFPYVTRILGVENIGLWNYFRIPCDTCDMNYDKFISEGNEHLSHIEYYHSQNTRRLDVPGMKEQLLRLRFIQSDLGLIPAAIPSDIHSE